MSMFDEDDDEDYDPFDPSVRHVQRAIADWLLLEAIKLCHTMLPDDRRTVEETEREIRRMSDRALSDFERDLHPLWRF